MADVPVDAAIAAASPDNAGPSFVAISDTIAYAFYGSGASFLYRKSTDAGASFAAGVTIEGLGTSAALSGASAWFDRWTPGNSGTLIHLVYIEAGGLGSNSAKYDCLDTNGDTLSGEIGISAALTGSGSANTAITRTVGGNLIVNVCAANNAGTWKSTAVGASASFSAIAACHETTSVDYVRLFPANLADTNDAWALFWDISADELSLKTYDDSANNWTNIGEASISTGMVEASLADGGVGGFAGSIRHSDGHLIVAAWTELDLATAGTADLKVWDITDAGTITAKTDVLTNVYDVYGCALYIDNNSDDIYCFYLGDGTTPQDYQATVSVFYKKSTDGGASWGSQTAYSEGAADDYRRVWCDLGCAPGETGLVGALWQDDDDNDYFFNAVNAIAVGGVTNIDENATPIVVQAAFTTPARLLSIAATPIVVRAAFTTPTRTLSPALTPITARAAFTTPARALQKTIAPLEVDATMPLAGNDVVHHRSATPIEVDAAFTTPARSLQSPAQPIEVEANVIDAAEQLSANAAPIAVGAAFTTPARSMSYGAAPIAVEVASVETVAFTGRLELATPIPVQAAFTTPAKTMLYPAAPIDVEAIFTAAGRGLGRTATPITVQALGVAATSLLTRTIAPLLVQAASVASQQALARTIAPIEVEALMTAATPTIGRALSPILLTVTSVPPATRQLDFAAPVVLVHAVPVPTTFTVGDQVVATPILVEVSFTQAAVLRFFEAVVARLLGIDYATLKARGIDRATVQAAGEDHATIRLKGRDGDE